VLANNPNQYNNQAQYVLMKTKSWENIN